MNSYHQVTRKFLNNTSNPVQIIVGTGIPGSTSYMHDHPWDIFVDTNLDLYVADRSNNRIQLFPLDQSNGKIVAGQGSSITTITLHFPSAIVLDAKKYLFIVDYGNSCIVGSGPNGFQCLVGCNGSG